MIVMPQLYQHEILFRAHDAKAHQGISEVVARIQERHFWPGIRRTVWQYVGECLTSQQVQDKQSDVRFHLKNTQSGYFNELVQYDHMKLCPSDAGNTGVWVISDRFSKFAGAVPCSLDEYDTITTSRFLLRKSFARHGTPTRMQSDKTPKLIADVSNEFMKASQVTKVRSTAGGSGPRLSPLVTNSSFSEAVSDKGTAELQQKEEQNAMALVRDTSPVSKEFIRTDQWNQDIRGGLITSPQTEGFWSISNISAVEAKPQREGCSGAPDDASSPGSKDTEAILESMTYVGGMNYANYRLEASRSKAFGKHK